MDLLGFDDSPRKGKIVVVTGGRDFEDVAFIENCLDDFHEANTIVALFHGAANGVDTICGSWAWKNGLAMFECKANWKTYPKAAGPIRNHWMKDFSGASHLLAFPGKKGTAHMIEACRKHGMVIVEYDPAYQGGLKCN